MIEQSSGHVQIPFFGKVSNFFNFFCQSGFNAENSRLHDHQEKG